MSGAAALGVDPSHGATSDVTFDGTFDGWRHAARESIQRGVPPDAMRWLSLGGTTQQAALALGGGAVLSPRAVARALTVPARFMKLAALVACHRDPARWDVLYRALWRITDAEPHLLEVATDPLVHRLLGMERAVRRAAHKMKAFVRFRELPEHDGRAGEVFVAWFEPTHDVTALVARFFARRFASMRWSLLTPDRCAHWDLLALHFTDGVARSDASAGDSLESLWRAYYAHTFNPARLRTAMMKSEMPQRYWHLLPEAPLIAELTRTAASRVQAMIAQVAAPPEAIPAELTAAAEVTLRRQLCGGGDDCSPEALERAGAWDLVHDPGTRESCRRAALVEGRVAAHAHGGVVRDRAHVVTGVAGWTDPTILNGQVFYPEGVSTPEARLRHYATRFGMVEVDATYYALPTTEMAEKWVERTPEHFIFNVKAHALMTGHPAEVAKLPGWVRDALPPSLRTARRVYARHLPARVIDGVWERFLAAIEPLRAAGRLGAVFLQYPKWFMPSREAAAQLAASKQRLGPIPAAVELRHRDWFAECMASRTLALLERLALAHTIVDAPPGTESSVPTVVAVTAPQPAVIRLHGRRTATWEARNARVTERYRYLYDAPELAAIRGWTLDVARQHQGVHVVFNNNHANYATTNALELTAALLEGA